MVIVQLRVQQHVEVHVLFRAVTTAFQVALVRALMDAMDVLVHAELPVVVVVQDVPDARVHVKAGVRVVANLDALLDVTDAVGLAEIHAPDVKDAHLDVQEAVRDVKLHAVANVPQAAETNVVVVGIVVIVDVAPAAQIHVQIIVQMGAILAHLAAPEGVKVIVMVVADHAETAAVEDVDLRVHQVALAVLDVVEHAQEAVEAAILPVTIAVQDVVVDAVVALQNVPDVPADVMDAQEAVFKHVAVDVTYLALAVLKHVVDALIHVRGVL